jgi:hypothetical protein
VIKNFTNPCHANLSKYFGCVTFISMPTSETVFYVCAISLTLLYQQELLFNTLIPVPFKVDIVDMETLADIQFTSAKMESKQLFC